jgi:hypothetical protein
MLPEDFDLLFGSELSALVCFVLFVVVAHGLFLVRKSISTQTLPAKWTFQRKQNIGQFIEGCWLFSQKLSELWRNGAEDIALLRPR